MTIEPAVPEELKESLKPCPVDFHAAENLLRRARKDLDSARLIGPSDSEEAYALIYNCMLHVGLAFMAVSGVRPEIRGKHKTVIRYMAHVLGKEYEDQIHLYERMRRKRHLLVYAPGSAESTQKEAEEAEKVAKGFLLAVTKRIRREHPQREFGF